jgi:hypothetical protein
VFRVDDRSDKLSIGGGAESVTRAEKPERRVEAGDPVAPGVSAAGVRWGAIRTVVRSGRMWAMLPSMRARAAASVLLAMELVACGGRTTSDGSGPADDSGALVFPVGTYARCARGTYAEDGSFLNTSGFIDGAGLVVKQSGATLSADYVDPSGPSESFEFALTTNTSATLAPVGQTASGFTGFCVLGVGVSNEQPYTAELTADAGALTYDSGVVFLSLTGLAAGDGGECGPHSSAAGVWLVCDSGPPAVPEDPAPSAASALPTGAFACSAHLATHYESDGIQQFVASGGQGTLALDQTGSEVTASYQGDSFVSGTVHFAATTATTAQPTAGQSLTTSCEVPITMGGLPPPKPETLPLIAGALTLDASTLFLSFAGTMGQSSSCAGAQKVGSIICTKE